DAELFISYNMPAKALDPLIAALPKAPRDLRLNQKLAALHTRAGRFAEAAVCCRTLESIYHDAGHADEAHRYSDLAAKYEQRGGSAEIAAPASAAAPAPAASAPAVQEFQISAPAPEPEAEPASHQIPADTPTVAQAAAAHPGLFFDAPSAPPASVAEF